MKILILVMLVNAVWVVRATVFGRCGGQPVAVERGSAAREAWFWERWTATRDSPAYRRFRLPIHSLASARRPLSRLPEEGKTPGPLKASDCAGQGPGGPGG
jgi:hypothetical protein